jgi:hypothetical protein
MTILPEHATAFRGVLLGIRPYGSDLAFEKCMASIFQSVSICVSLDIGICPDSRILNQVTDVGLEHSSQIIKNREVSSPESTSRVNANPAQALTPRRSPCL